MSYSSCRSSCPGGSVRAWGRDARALGARPEGAWGMRVPVWIGRFRDVNWATQDLRGRRKWLKTPLAPLRFAQYSPRLNWKERNLSHSTQPLPPPVTTCPLMDTLHGAHEDGSQGDTGDRGQEGRGRKHVKESFAVPRSRTWGLKIIRLCPCSFPSWMKFRRGAIEAL